MPLLQDRLLDLLTSSSARYQNNAPDFLVEFAELVYFLALKNKNEISINT